MGRSSTTVDAPSSTASIGATGVATFSHGISRKRPCLAPSSRVQAMPGPAPPRHAKPRRDIFNRGTPPSSSVLQFDHPLYVEPPVVAARLRPPVAEPDTAAARGQPRRQLVLVHQCCRARGTDRNWTRVDRKMSWSPAASSSQQRARVLTDVKARRFAPPPLRGADGLDAGSAHARPDWLLPTMLTHTPPTCCGRRPVQNDALSGDR